MIIFYSWQLDLPAATNKTFIQSCLKDAISKLQAEIDLQEADRQEDIKLDHDTKGVLGHPDIVATILKKIDDADVFVADVSLTGKATNGQKLFPNPNVMVELGYAIGKLGPERLILVMDEEYGTPNDLPFDLAHKRWPVTFSSRDPDAKKKLTKELSGIVKAHYLASTPKASSQLALKWQVSNEDGTFYLVFGVKNIGPRQVRDPAIRFRKSNTFNPLALEKRRKYETGMYELKADSRDSDTALVKPYANQQVAIPPEDTEWLVKFDTHYTHGGKFQSLDFEYDLYSDQGSEPGRIEITEQDFRTIGRVLN